jgi:hypothetical protein
MELLGSIPGLVVSGRPHIDSLIRTIETEMQGLSALQAAASQGLSASMLQVAELIEASGGQVLTTGMGKSGIIGRKMSATFASTGTPSHFVHPAEASHGDLGMIGQNDVVLALSWSGETPELADIIAYTRRFKISLVHLTWGYFCRSARRLARMGLLQRRAPRCSWWPATRWPFCYWNAEGFRRWISSAITQEGSLARVFSPSAS